MKEQKVEIPEGVTASVKSKVVTISCGTKKLVKNFRNVPVQLIEVVDDKKRVVAIAVRIWFAKNKQKSCVTTICKHISNMIVGVTKGFIFTMKFGYNLHPMQPLIIDNGHTLQVTNYLGGKYIRKVPAVPGSMVTGLDTDAKKEIEITGIDRDAVGKTCSLINQSCRPFRKDRRKFKDGIYTVSKEVKKD